MKRLQNKVQKPWGSFENFAERKGFWHLKVIKIKKGHRLSLQRHKKRSELWIVAEGKIKALRGNKSFILSPRQTFYIEKDVLHRMEALSNSIVIEVSFGTHLEKDIERLSDDYQREN